MNIADAIFLLDHLFNGGPAPLVPGSGDANRDGSLNIADAIFLLDFLFNGGPPP